MSSPVLKRGEIISQDIRDTISKRYRTVTRAINKEFWNSQSDTQHSLYVGSYGRGTAIDTSDFSVCDEAFGCYKTQYRKRHLLEICQNASFLSTPDTEKP